MAKKKTVKAKPEYVLVRKNKKTGKIEPAKRGRRNLNEFSYGYQNAGASKKSFTEGLPPGYKARPKTKKSGAAKQSLSGGLGSIEMIVQREVEIRLKKAKDAAIRAFEKALES